MDVCKHFTAEVMTSYGDIATKAEVRVSLNAISSARPDLLMQMYIWSNPEKYFLQAHVGNHVVRKQVKTMLTDLAANARSDVHKMVRCLLIPTLAFATNCELQIKTNVPLEQMTETWWSKVNLEKQNTLPPRGLYASFALLVSCLSVLSYMPRSLTT
jgi:hypothetical protein